MICKNTDGKEFHAWRVPAIGTVADEDVPHWMLSRMMEGAIQIDRLGGLLALTPDSAESSLPGDYMLFDSVEGIIKFCPERTFDEHYTVH